MTSVKRPSALLLGWMRVKPMNIGFYAPLKSPDHAVPSGDRTMARSLIKALQYNGHHVDIASHFRSYLRDGDGLLDELRACADDECDKLLKEYSNGVVPLPDIWLSYHPFYKSPDLLGPKIAGELKIPYVTIEASWAAKRLEGAWAKAARQLKGSLIDSDMHIYFTPQDKEGLLQIIPSDKITHLAPFIDIEAGIDTRQISAEKTLPKPVTLLCVAMMRDDVKRESYAVLAQALPQLLDIDWVLHIVGDGPARRDIVQMFSGFEDRLKWLGEKSSDELPAIYANADVFVWPGLNEAYGLVYLEAQSHGLPVIAFESGGVASVVSPPESGALCPPGDVAAYAQLLRRFIVDKTLRGETSSSARNYFHKHHTLQAACVVLERAMMQACHDTATSVKK